jgi:hypothetical protein
MNGLQAARRLHAHGLAPPLIAAIGGTCISAAKDWLAGTHPVPQGATTLRLQVAVRALDALAPSRGGIRGVSRIENFADLVARHCR